MGRKGSRPRAPSFSEQFLEKMPRLVRAEYESLPPEERAQFAPEIAKISAALGFTSNMDAAFAMVSTDGRLLETSARDLHTGNSLALLRLAVECSFLKDKRLSTQIHGCPTPAAYRREVDNRIDLSPRRFNDLAASGDAFRLRYEELLNGVDGEPGIPLVDLARSITKLPHYEAVRKRVGPKEAIRAMVKYSYVDFKGFARRDDPWVTVTAAEVTAKLSGAQAEKAVQPPAKVVPRHLPEVHSEFERQLLRGVQFGRDLCIASSDRSEALDYVEADIRRYRKNIDAQNRDHFGGSPLGIGTSHPLNEDLLTSRNAFDLEEYIRKGIANMAADRWTVTILVARLRYEDQFQPRWNFEHGAFSVYARVVLGIGEELRDLLRVGRNLLKYPFFLEGQEGLNTDNAFYSFRYVDLAMEKHANDVDLIRARLRSLTTREFAEFARDPLFDERGLKKSLTIKQEECYTKLLNELNNQLALGRSVKIIEILTEGERGKIATLIGDAESALAARDAEDRAGAFIASDVEFHPMSDDEPTISAEQERVVAYWRKGREEELEELNEFLRKDAHAREFEDDRMDALITDLTSRAEAEASEERGVQEALRLVNHEDTDRNIKPAVNPSQDGSFPAA